MENLIPNMKRVGELMSELTPRLNLADRFRFDMTTQEALDLLTAAYRCEVERRHREFALDRNTNAALNSLAEYLTKPVPEFGVMCCGVCGNGKTTLMAAFQSSVNYLERKHHFSFLDTKYRNFVGSIQIIDAKDVVQAAKDYKKFRDLMSRPLLAIDDIGKEPAEILEYGNALSPVIDLLEYRYARQLFTFVTTNLTGAAIRAKYGDRIADRFNEMFHVIVFQDISYRTHKIRKQ